MLLSFGQGSLWRAVPRRPLPAASSRWLSATASLAGSIFLMALRHVPASLHWRPGRSAAPLRRPSRSAAASRWLSATSLPVCTGVPAGQQLRYGAPASNKPHPAEKSTPVWLAIWRTWAGFANSQQRCAAFRSTY